MVEDDLFLYYEKQMSEKKRDLDMDSIEGGRCGSIIYQEAFF